MARTPPDALMIPEEVRGEIEPGKLAPKRIHKLKVEERANTKYAYATRCPRCFAPIVLTLKYPECKIVPVEAASWAISGSIYYIKGKHERHNQRCPVWLAKVRKARKLPPIDGET